MSLQTIFATPRNIAACPSGIRPQTATITPYYGITIGSFRAYDVNKELTDTVWRPTDIQIPRVEGTLYLMK